MKLDESTKKYKSKNKGSKWKLTEQKSQNRLALFLE